jgi:hypothetical protein
LVFCYPSNKCVCNGFAAKAGLFGPAFLLFGCAINFFKKVMTLISFCLCTIKQGKTTLKIKVMKKLVILTGLLFMTAAAVHAQTKGEVVEATLKLMGYSIGQEWNCPLKEGQYFTKTFKFDEGVNFDVIALSEDGNVQDVDMEILSPLGIPLLKDTRSGYAEVNFTPNYTRSLTIKVKNYNSDTPNNASTMYFIVAYKQ